MKKIHLPEWLIQLVIIVSLPTVSCFGYYSLEFLEEKKSMVVLLVIISYPVALIGLVGLFRSLISPERTKLALSFWGLCLIMPTIIIIWVRA